MSDSAVQVYETRSGKMLALRGDTYITRSLEAYGEYCPGEWKLLKQLIRPGMTVVEVGSNIGPHSVDMARACAPGPFYAFEPQPRIFQILCANLALNGVDNALAYPEGLGEAEGEAVVPALDYAASRNFGGIALQRPGQPGVKVRIRTLDSLGLETCGLLKIDVEGFEPQVLRGGRQTIARCRPVIYVENDREAQQAEVISLVSEMDYDAYWDVPGLFSADNFRGAQEDIFGGVASVNMLCIPRERKQRVAGSRFIDPDNWTAPFSRRR